MTELPVRTVVVDGLELGYLEAGEGPLVICQHGFPDSMWSFSDLVERLADAGFHAVAPALRGYSPSGLPDEPRPDLLRLAGDMLGLADALGAESFDVVGHDWGSPVGVTVANLAPDRARRLVIASVPHFMHVLTHPSPRQAWRSRYMLQFQLPLLPERIVDAAWLEGLARRWSPGFDPPPSVTRGLDSPARVRAALGLYRGIPKDLASRRVRKVAFADVAVPALYVHGARDACMGVELGRGQESRFRAGLRSEVIDDAGHFVALEAPERFAELVLGFLAH